MKPELYIATVLLEKNRWTPDKIPSYLVSDWIGRFAEAGFDGIELWENHAGLAGEEELGRLAASACPVRIFNSYAPLDGTSAAARRRATALCERFGVRAMKFNFPPPSGDRENALRELSAWLAELPDGFRMLCECHAGTMSETPDSARRLFDALADPRLEAIAHPLQRRPGDPARLDLEALARWFDRMGGRITHLHYQTRDGRRPEDYDALAGFLKDAGFRGTHTLEFTVGTGSPGETPEGLWREAMTDLGLLRARILP